VVEAESATPTATPNDEEADRDMTTPDPPVDPGPHLLFDVDRHVATITLNRPEKGNALSPAMAEGMQRIWERVRTDPSIRCVIITGAGDRHLCTGADLDAVAESGRVSGGFGPITHEVRYSSRQCDVWKPVICAVNGTVAGGGLHFVVDADIIVASKGVTFLDTHVNVGMVGAIENIGLAKRLPLGTALRMTLQGRNYRLTAERAFQLGLVDELTEPEELMSTARAIAGDIALNSPTAVSLSQRAVWSSVEMPYSHAVEYGYALLRMNWMHPDFTEGPRAFTEGRAPTWTVDTPG
jgi:enoyl-CoA hydratase/carnithine racemase